MSAKGKNKQYDGVDSVEIAFIFMMIVLLIFTYIFTVVRVKGPSMDNTLHDKDRLIVEKLGYDPKDYDIVIINCHDANLLIDNQLVSLPSSLDENIVKRVIATEGQTVDIDFETGIVTVDGKATKDDFTSSSTNMNEGAFDYPVTVPKGYVFVMGDNRAVSMDSRSSEVGFIDKKDIIGKVSLRIAPISRFGTLD